MRKRIIGSESVVLEAEAEAWIDLELIAQVEISSEAPGYPIEAALHDDIGWRAAGPGTQTIRLIFDQPQRIRRIRLRFSETERQRTQEFVLRWSPDGGRSYQDVVRQQYTFSPPSTTDELEDYRVALDGVTVLALELIPEMGGGEACASLAALRVA